MKWIRRRPLTPEEIAERDAKARQRMAKAEEAEQARARRSRLAEEHAARQLKAAGISSVTLICHKDTWDFASGIASQRTDWRHVHQDRITARPYNMLGIHLSGYQLVILLTELWAVSRHAYLGDRRALATRFYTAIAQVVDSVNPDAPKTAPVPPIVIDDQAEADDSE